MVASADRRATAAGTAVLRAGGSAVDAAIATNAVLAVTAPHLCGLGGDLFALVHDGDEVVALNASGRSGSGADPDDLRSEGHTEMPFRHDIRTVTVPGCVDGWCELHQRFGRLPLDRVLALACALAEEGAEASPLLVASVRQLDDRGRSHLHELSAQATRRGAVVTRPGVGRVLRAIGDAGRDAFYLGEFGEGLRRLGDGLFTVDDLQRSQADWVTPLAVDVLDIRLHTIPPNSQGYLLLASLALAVSTMGPRGVADLDDPETIHLLVECAKAVGHSRPELLHEHADVGAVLESALGGRPHVDLLRASSTTVPTSDGDTTYLCVVDSVGMGVSLIQSNASGFGSWLAEPSTGINLHNRGLGFSLVPGHPAELGPRRRPPHTLSPALATAADGRLRAVLGTMGGDAQPQILLQIAAALFAGGEHPGDAVNRARWILHAHGGFDTWTSSGGPSVLFEESVGSTVHEALRSLGHRTATSTVGSTFGHAHAIVVDGAGARRGGADHRAMIGSVEPG